MHPRVKTHMCYHTHPQPCHSHMHYFSQKLSKVKTIVSRGVTKQRAPFSDAPVKHLDPSRPTAHPEGLC